MALKFRLTSEARGSRLFIANTHYKSSVIRLSCWAATFLIANHGVCGDRRGGDSTNN